MMVLFVQLANGDGGSWCGASPGLGLEPVGCGASLLLNARKWREAMDFSPAALGDQHSYSGRSGPD